LKCSIVQQSLSLRLNIHCLNETYKNTRTGEHLCDAFPDKNDLEKGGAIYRRCFSTLAQSMPLRRSKELTHINFWSMVMMFIYWARIKKETQQLYWHYEEGWSERRERVLISQYKQSDMAQNGRSSHTWKTTKSSIKSFFYFINSIFTIYSQ
jgi:hypothetical protein